MSGKTSIEWTGNTWNPIRARNLVTGKVGWHCEHVHAGCANCYAAAMNRWVGTGLAFKPTHRNEVEVFLDPKAVLEPLRWRKDGYVFPCSMTDLFADFVPDEWIDQMFAVMVLAGHHTFQVLTKRIGRARRYLEQVSAERFSMQRWTNAAYAVTEGLSPRFCENYALSIPAAFERADWPLKNVWIGYSASDQKTLDAGWADLEQVPAALRWLSLEPLLGAVDLRGRLPIYGHTGEPCCIEREGLHRMWRSEKVPTPSAIGWVVVGGESGRGARPCDVDQVRDIVRQCRVGDVPVFVKQLGARPVSNEPLAEYVRGTWGKGGAPSLWPEDLRVREMPKVAA